MTFATLLFSSYTGNTKEASAQDYVVEEEQQFVTVEQMPSFKGGDIMTFRNWAMSKVKYPMITQENGIQGRVLVSFVIEKDGTLGQIKVLSSPDQMLSEEAIRVLEMSPKWKPGMSKNQPVRVQFTMPFDFRLTN